MLKINKFYMFYFPDNEQGFYQVLEEFPNNFVKVLWLRAGYKPAWTKKSHFREITCTEMFINLSTVNSLREIDIPD